MTVSKKTFNCTLAALAAFLVMFAVGCTGNAQEEDTGKTVEPPKDAALKPDAVPGSGGQPGTQSAGASGNNPGAAGQAANSAGGFPPPPEH